MKKALFVAAAFILLSGTAVFAEKITIDIHAVSVEGMGKKLGTVVAEDSPEGLLLTVNLKGIPEGDHGFHIHEHPSCEPAEGADGKPGAALSAGGHYDPEKTGRHLGPVGDGHKGDLPYITANKKGVVKESVVAYRLTVEEIKGRSIMIHAGGDNYSDDPQPLGGGGARIACGIIK